MSVHMVLADSANVARMTHMQLPVGRTFQATKRGSTWGIPLQRKHTTPIFEDYTTL